MDPNVLAMSSSNICGKHGQRKDQVVGEKARTVAYGYVDSIQTYSRLMGIIITIVLIK
jgi:hypothetical protein